MLAVRYDRPRDETLAFRVLSVAGMRFAGLIASISPMVCDETKMGPLQPPRSAIALRHWRSSGGIMLIKIEMLIIYELASGENALRYM